MAGGLGCDVTEGVTSPTGHPEVRFGTWVPAPPISEVGNTQALGEVCLLHPGRRFVLAEVTGLQPASSLFRFGWEAVSVEPKAAAGTCVGC